MPPKSNIQPNASLPADFFDSDKKQYAYSNLEGSSNKSAGQPLFTDDDLSTLDQEFLEFEKEVKLQSVKAADTPPAPKEDTPPKEVSEKDILDFDNSISREEDEEIVKQEMVLRLQSLQQKRKNMTQLQKDDSSAKKLRNGTSINPKVDSEDDSDSDSDQEEPDWWTQTL